MAHAVFVNYRGDDSQFCGALIYRALADRCGRAAVFIDSGSIRAGDDFQRVILRRLRESSIVLAVIGPHWLTAVDGGGRRRIDLPEDWVRRELSIAFALELRIVPVLIDEARLPSAAELPPDIARLSDRQFVCVRRRHAEEDVDRLIDRLLALDPELERGGATADGGTDDGGTDDGGTDDGGIDRGRGDRGDGDRGGTDRGGGVPWAVVNYNEGIQMTGGSLTVTGSAIGRGADVTDRSRQRRELRVLLRALREHVDANTARFADSVAVAAALDEIEEELDRHRPRGSRLLRLVGVVDAQLRVAGLATRHTREFVHCIEESFQA